MKKGFIAAVILAMLVSMSTVGFAQEAAKTYGQVLSEIGLIQGSNGDLNESGELTRTQMVVILNRLGAKSDEAFTPPAKATFTDVPTTHWAYKDVEKAYSDKVTTGIGNGKFGVNNKITYQQAAAFLLRVLGYEVSYDKALTEAAAKGIKLAGEKSANANLLRADIFELMTKTLVANVNGSNEQLVASIAAVDESHRTTFLNEYAQAINPELRAFSYTPVADVYKGSDEFLKKSSADGRKYGLQVEKVVNVFTGTGTAVSYADFFKLINPEETIDFQFAWSEYSNDPEYGEYGIYGWSYVSIDESGYLFAHVTATEGESGYEASNPTVTKYKPVTVDGKQVTPYHVEMDLEGFTGEIEPYDLFFLLDAKGVYTVASVGAFGDGVHTRQ